MSKPKDQEQDQVKDETAKPAPGAEGEIAAEELEQASGGILIAGATPPPAQKIAKLPGVSPGGLPPNGGIDL